MNRRIGSFPALRPGRVLFFTLISLVTLAWPYLGAHAAGASCDPSKGFYKVQSLGSNYNPFTGSTYFSYKVSAASGAKDLSNYVVSTPVCSSIKAFTSSVPLSATCVVNEKFSGLTGYKVNTGITAPGSRVDTIEMNGSFTGSSGNFAVKAGTCADTMGTVTLVPTKKASSGTVQFKQNNLTVSETSGQAVMKVSRVGGSDGTLSVNFTTVDGTALAGTNYTAVSGTLTWLSGDTTDKVIAIPLTNTKTFYEVDKTFNVTLTSVDNNYSISNTVSISSNPEITMTYDNVIVSSYDAEATISMVRTDLVDPALTVSVVANTSDLTAVAGKDYVAVTDLSVTLNPEETYTAVNVSQYQATAVEDTQYTVKVVDQASRQASSVVTIRGTGSTSAVAISNLEDGQTVAGATAVEMTASQNVAPVSYQLYANGTLVASQNTSESSATLTWDTTLVADGNYVVQAKLVYNNTIESSNPVTVTVVNQPAQVAGTITSPSDLEVVQGTLSVTYTVNKDTVASKLSVCDLAGCTVVANQSTDAGNLTGTYTWDSASVANGTYTLTVDAVSATAVESSGSVTITVYNPPVQVAGTITSPSDLEVVQGTLSVTYTLNKDTVASSLSVCTDAGCTLVAKQSEDAGNLSGTYTWDSTSVANGTYTLKVTAVSATAVETSGTVTVTVSNQQQQVAGTVTSHTDGYTAVGTVDVTYVVADDTAKAELFVCDAAGCTVADAQSPATGTFAWDSTTVADGAYTLKVLATSVNGQQTAGTVTVTVANQQQQVAGTITSPKDGSIVAGTVKVTYVVARDTVEAKLLVCGAAGCTTVDGQSPATGTFAWDSTTVADGAYTLKVLAISVNGQQTAGSVTVTVANKQ